MEKLSYVFTQYFVSSVYVRFYFSLPLIFTLLAVLIELFYIGMPVVWTDGRSLGVRSRDYQIFWDGSGWVDYHISLVMGLRPCMRASRAGGALL